MRAPNSEARKQGAFVIMPLKCRVLDVLPRCGTRVSTDVGRGSVLARPNERASGLIRQQLLHELSEDAYVATSGPLDFV